jgi:hypothetical protein
MRPRYSGPRRNRRAHPTGIGHPDCAAAKVSSVPGRLARNYRLRRRFFLAESRVGAPLTAGFLSIAMSIAIGTLALRAWRQRDSRPFWLGLLGAATLLYGKCIVTVPLLPFAGLCLLIGAAYWDCVGSVLGKILTRKFALFSADRGATTPSGTGSSEPSDLAKYMSHVWQSECRENI